MDYPKESDCTLVNIQNSLHITEGIGYTDSGFFVLSLGSLVNLRKATISFSMSVRPHGKARLPQDGFS